MVATFGDQLKLFALSIDVVSRERFDRITSLVEKYCQDTLHIEYTRIYLASEVDGYPGLKRYSLGIQNMENIRPVKDNYGKYCNHTSLAFDRGKPLWIVSKVGKQRLEKSTKYTDMWSGFRAIPTFRQIGGKGTAGDEIKTSVIVPIPVGNDILGVINFETTDYIEATSAAKTELTKIAEAVGILLHLFRVNEIQKSSTELALQDLQLFLNRPLPKLTKPKLFLASSSQADSDVIEAVHDVLKVKAYADRLDLIYWKTMDKPGNITKQLLDAIGSCRYAICYFSQRGPENHYVDNPNVVFEAGMFHGRVDEISTVPASWIPIREQDSENLPFDFAQERILMPERTKTGVLKRNAFSASLRRSLDAMIDEDA